MPKKKKKKKKKSGVAEFAASFGANYMPDIQGLTEIAKRNGWFLDMSKKDLRPLGAGSSRAQVGGSGGGGARQLQQQKATNGSEN